MNPFRRPKGLYDSSATRVWPVFCRLLRRDPGGLSWLPAILDLPGVSVDLAVQLSKNITPLLPVLSQKRKIGGNVLKHFGGGVIELEACFEKTIPPSQGFLRWLVQHPEYMTWPQQGKRVYSIVPQTKREQLFGKHGGQAQARVQAEALAEIERLGVQRAHKKWWSFEGKTHVDCFLETDNMILLIEGKRTEKLSTRIDWYPDRNQLVRNLEVAQEMAGSKNFAVLVISEEEIEPVTAEVAQKSLPHFEQSKSESLMQHYLGCISWRDVCRATHIAYDCLPNTVREWISQIKD